MIFRIPKIIQSSFILGSRIIRFICLLGIVMNTLTKELINRAFLLAYFIHREKKLAINIATEAIAQLEVALLAQDKRSYYKLSGRAKSVQNNTAKYRTKISLNELHLLQRLVYVESELHELEQENDKVNLSQENMIIRFIKYLVKITSKRNSFYVNVGLSRLLYNYATPEAIDIYNVIIQDSNRTKDDAYYRSRKKQLVTEIQERFGELIKTIRVERGEERFLTIQSANHSTIKLVEECLNVFTPWDTSCLIPEKFDPLNASIEKLSFNGKDPDQEHPIELNRMHCIIHPQCYWRLIMSLNFDSPDTRLELPKFQISEKDEDIEKPPKKGNEEKLSESELNVIEQLLASYADKRRANPSRFLSIFVDGHKKGELDIYQVNSISLEINGSPEQIAIRRKEDNTLLALYVWEESQIKESKLTYSNIIESGQEITVTISFTRDFDEFITSANLTISYEETALYRKLLLLLNKLLYSNDKYSFSWKPVLAFTSLVLAIVLVSYTYYNRPLETVSSFPQNTPKITVTPKLTNLNKNNQLAPELTSQQNTSTNTPTPIATSKPNNDSDVIVANNNKQNTLSEISKNSSSSEDLLIYRNPQDNFTIKSLSEVKSVYVDQLGENNFSKEIREKLIEQLSNTKIIKYSENIDEVDSVIKGSVSEKDADNFTISLKLVNADGETLWSVSTRKINKHEINNLPILLKSIKNNLVRNIEKARSKTSYEK